MPDTTSSPQAEISTGIAQVYKARYGRGPRRIVAHVHDDAVVCLLVGVNTPALNTLVQYGKIDAAQVVHAELQLGMAPEMSAIVERATGRTVVAYVPGFNARADATTDTFLLEALVAPSEDELVGAALERLGEALTATRAHLDRLLAEVARLTGE